MDVRVQHLVSSWKRPCLATSWTGKPSPLPFLNVLRALFAVTISRQIPVGQFPWTKTKTFFFFPKLLIKNSALMKPSELSHLIKSFPPPRRVYPFTFFFPVEIKKKNKKNIQITAPGAFLFLILRLCAWGG